MKYRIIASLVVVAALLLTLEFFTDSPADQTAPQSQPQPGKKFNF